MRGCFVREFHHMQPPPMFLHISFNFLVLTVALIAPGGGEDLTAYAATTVAALVCGKAVLRARVLAMFFGPIERAKPAAEAAHD